MGESVFLKEEGFALLVLASSFGDPLICFKICLTDKFRMLNSKISKVSISQFMRILRLRLLKKLKKEKKIDTAEYY